MVRIVSIVLFGLAALGAILFLITGRSVENVDSERGLPSESRSGKPSESPDPMHIKKVNQEGRDGDSSVSPTEECKRLFTKILERHKTSGKGIAVGTAFSRLAKEKLFSYTEGRLLALSYPAEVAALVGPLAEDPTRPTDERQFAFYILGALANSGYMAASEPLIRLANSDDLVVASSAIYHLHQSDQNGENVELYRKLINRGVFEAAVPLSRWVDSGSISSLREVIQKFHGEGFESVQMREYASESLEKIELLSSPGSDSKLSDIISSPTHERQMWLSWALQVSQNRLGVSVQRLIRGRLDMGIAKAREDILNIDPDAKLEDMFSKALEIGGSGDPYFDELLIHYVRIGGTPTEMERSRLRNFGYWGDPKSRLEEIVGSR